MLNLALSLPNLTEPARLVDLGVRAETSGWDGVLVWDHVHGSPQMPMPVSDPWVVLGALAVRTERVRLGTAITPLARRRPAKLARETVTVDQLSGGRLVLGVGLGEPRQEYTSYGETADRAVLAAKLDDGLELLAKLWSGEPVEHDGPHHKVHDVQFLPTPVQRPRVPVWTACIVPNVQPLRRAARWDGVVLSAIDSSTGGVEPVRPEQVQTAVAEVSRHRSPRAGEFDVAVTYPRLPDHAEQAALTAAGVTWVLVTGWVDDLAELAAAAPR